MGKKNKFSLGFYKWNRQLHLYFGVFICPFLVIFAVSTILMNHGVPASPSDVTTTVPMALPESILEKVAKTDLTPPQKNEVGKEVADHALDELGLYGEVLGFGPVRDNKKVVTVMRPGMTTRVTVDLEKQEAVVLERNMGMLDTMRYLHRNPGPHNIQGPKWIVGKAWGWIADTTVYVTLFLTLSGIYMWYVIKAERKTGLVFVGTGCVSLFAILYALLAG